MKKTHSHPRSSFFIHLHGWATWRTHRRNQPNITYPNIPQTKPTQEAYDVRLSSTKLDTSERAKVLAAYLKRASFLRRHGSSGSGVVDDLGGGGPLPPGLAEAGRTGSGGSFVSPARGRGASVSMSASGSPRKPAASSSSSSGPL